MARCTLMTASGSHVLPFSSNTLLCTSIVELDTSKIAPSTNVPYFLCLLYPESVKNRLSVVDFWGVSTLFCRRYSRFSVLVACRQSYL